MQPKRMEDWHQRIRRDLAKAKKQRHQSNVKRLLKEENAYFDSIKKKVPPRAQQTKINQITSNPKSEQFQAQLNQLQINHAVKMQHLHEARKLYEALIKHAQAKASAQQKTQNQRNHLQAEPKPRAKSNQEAKAKTKAVRKKRPEAIRKNLKISPYFLKNSEKNKINRFKIGIKLRKKLLNKKRKRKLFSRTGSSKAITAHTLTPSKHQAKIIHPIHLTNTSPLLKQSFLSSSTSIDSDIGSNKTATGSVMPHLI